MFRGSEEQHSLPAVAVSRPSSFRKSLRPRHRPSPLLEATSGGLELNLGKAGAWCNHVTADVPPSESCPLITEGQSEEIAPSPYLFLYGVVWWTVSIQTGLHPYGSNMSEC